MKEALTKEQKKLVEENHNLIYKFAKKKNLMIDEYYGILAIGLCKAATIFKEDSGKFSTIAYCCMDNELTDYYRHINRKRCIPEDMILSYDVPRSNDDSDDKGSFLENFADNHCTHDIVVSSIMSELLVGLLSEKEKVIVALLLNGMTHKEIAMRIKCSRQGVGYCIQQIRKKWIIYTENN